MVDIIDDVRTFRADRAWGARDIAELDGTSVRLHWTDQPYIWHENDGSEVFVVLDGTVKMAFERGGEVHEVMLVASDIFVAEPGDRHVATPVGEARILVIEKSGSV
ncbi:MAG: cupin [Sphingomonas sp.]